MANITNIKLRNDETVHPIALPFAVCTATAGATLKPLSFAGSIVPTTLTDGQQIMVQFTNGSDVAAPSINVGTFTIPLVINNSDSSVAPYIGEGAIVCLTYKNNNFYVSNAAALTGYKVPQDVTLATVTNEGTITNINNNGTITTLDSSSTITNLINDGTITNITSSGTILGLINAQNGIMGISGNTAQTAVLNRGVITKIKNDSGDDGNGNIQVLYNDSNATVDYINNHGKIKEIQNPGTLGNEGLPTLSGGLANSGHLYRMYNSDEGTIYTIDNGGLVSKVSNSGTITELKNSWYSITDFGTIEQFVNEADIKTLTIGTSGSWTLPGKVETLYNHAGSFTYTSPTFTLISGINYFENKGRIVTEENTGDIGFAGTVPAVPVGRTPTGNNYDPDTGIQNTTGIIHNIQNDYKGLHTHNAVIRHIANYGGNGTGGISLFDNGGDLSYLVNLEPVTDGAAAIPGGNIGEIINGGTIKEIQNSGTLGNIGSPTFSGGLTNSGHLYKIINQNTGTIYNIYNSNQIQALTNNSIITKLTNNEIGHINTLANLGTIEALENGGNITITNQPTTGGHNNGVLYITNEAYTGSSDDRYSGYVNITNNGELHATNSSTNDPVELSNFGKINTINNSGTISSLVSNGTITTFTNTIGGSPQIEGNIGTFNLDYGSINTFNADSGITNFNIESHGFIDTLAIYQKVPGYSPAITTLNNGNRITTLNNNANGTISTLRNKGYISTLNSSDGRINNLSNLTAKIGINLPAGVIKECTISDVIGSGIWRIDPGFSSSTYAYIQVDNKDLGILGYNCHYIVQSSTDASSLLYRAAGDTSYAPLNTGGDPYYVSPQGTAGSNCLLIIWEGVSIGHNNGASTSATLTPGIYRIYYLKAVNKIYHYQIDKLNFGRL